LGGGRSATLFADAEARHDFGGGWGVTASARHGWTNFPAGKLETGAYSFDLRKAGVLGTHDRLGLRFAQPLRIEHGGFSMMLPTSFEYGTMTATDSPSFMSLSPTGHEVDSELSYGSPLLGGNAWVGGNLFYRRDP